MLWNMILQRVLWLGGVLSFKAWGEAVAIKGQCSQTPRRRRRTGLGRLPWSKLLEADLSPAEQPLNVLGWSVQRPVSSVQCPCSDKLKKRFLHRRRELSKRIIWRYITVTALLVLLQHTYSKVFTKKCPVYKKFEHAGWRYVVLGYLKMDSMNN